MNAPTATASPPLDADRTETRRSRGVATLPLWQLNLLRVGYLVIGLGNVVVKWPLLFQGGERGLAEGTVLCILIAMSALALVGLRYPRRMLPILLFEVAWKLLWLGTVALPAWRSGSLDAATRTQIGSVLWVAVAIVVIPWRQVWRDYLRTGAEPWRRRR